MLAKLVVAAGLVLCLGACVLFVFGPVGTPVDDTSVAYSSGETPTLPPDDRCFTHGRLTSWWDRDVLPGRPTTELAQSSLSNIHPADYAGPAACQKCHEKNFAAWSQHPHRWMNALATPETVKGDFCGVSISYLGGTARFATDDEGFRMDFDRDHVRRTYRVTQTIGSRFYQYYVGKLLRGPEAPGHPAYGTNHVLPFGYWLDRHEWVPVVHVGYDEAPDGHREDPFARNLPPAPLSPYFQCNSCHTTFPLGDELLRNFKALGRHPPLALHWSMPDYLNVAHQERLPDVPPRAVASAKVEAILIGMQHFEASEHAVTLGVSCEACHLGCQDHVQGKVTKPSFFPISPYLNVEADRLATGREHQNVNWACGRCHAGERPYYAAGMATWNSTEYTDASKGACYSQLTCVHCHNPHQATGSQWTRTASQDDASCVQCHPQFGEPDRLVEHTHHPVGSTGSNCMNCHMPRVNEGLQDVVRTHTIFSPTNAAMIESNQLNACNICHVDKPIDWTLTYLQQWYGARYAESNIAANYPLRNQATVLGWLKSGHEAVRLAATDAMARSTNTSALSAWIDLLDDPYLLNRQFTRISLEKRFGVDLQEFGYHFYMAPEERREPIARVREALVSRVAE